MLDKCTYKGGNHVIANNSEGRIRIIQPRSGTVNKFIRWWNRNGNHYIDCAIFRVELTNGIVVRLVVPQMSRHVDVHIHHDGLGNFTFPGCQVDRIAVVAEDSKDILVEYQFSKISGGSVLKRTLTGIPEPAVEIVEETVTEDVEDEIKDDTDDEDYVVDLNSMTKKQLLEWALEQGFDMVDNHTKAELLLECQAILDDL